MTQSQRKSYQNHVALRFQSMSIIGIPAQLQPITIPPAFSTSVFFETNSNNNRDGAIRRKMR